MPDWERKRILIAVRTYPVPSAKSIEASCTAGISASGRWVRLFPVPYRLMDQDKRFNKWQWIDVDVIKATDGRPESYKINPDSIVIGDRVSTKNGWKERRELIQPLRQLSQCRIRRERDKNGSPTLGVFRPFQIKRLIIEKGDENWTPEQLTALQQNTLFQKAPEHTLEKIPFDFRYEFRCGDADCAGHIMLCTDWKMGQAYRRWKNEYGDGWEAAFRNRFEKEMIEKFDTHFFVGTVHQYPSTWIIVGLFYPPKESENDLFAI